MQKIKIRSSRKNLLVNAAMTDLIFISGLEICCGWLFPHVSSSDSIQPVQLALQKTSRALTAKRCPGGKRGLYKSPLSRGALHPTGMERVPVPCHPPCISPTGFCSFPRPAEHTALGNAQKKKNMDTCTGLKVWPAVTEILGSLHYRDLSLFPFPELLVLVLI